MTLTFINPVIWPMIIAVLSEGNVCFTTNVLFPIVFSIIQNHSHFLLLKSR